VGVNQHYLYEARQMQALSLTVHIPLVCFGIAFPVLVLFAEYRYLRTGDTLYRTLAKRWSRIMLALFAVGVVTGTILSFELGLLWPVWMQDFGNVFGLGFTLEGFSFFVEAIFIGIYAYGWDRLRPWAVQPLEQRIEALLDLFALAAFATQGAEQLGDHLFEHGGVIGKGRGVDR